MTVLVRIFLLLALLAVARGFYRAWRLTDARRRESRHAAETGKVGSSGKFGNSDKYGNLSDQEVSDADFEEIP